MSEQPGASSPKSSLSNTRPNSWNESHDTSSINHEPVKTAMSKVLTRFKLGLPRSKTSPALLISSPMLEGSEDRFQADDVPASTIRCEIEERKEMTETNKEILRTKASTSRRASYEEVLEQRANGTKRVSIILPNVQGEEQKSTNHIMLANKPAYKMTQLNDLELEREEARKRAKAVMSRLDAILGPPPKVPCVYTTFMFACNHWKRPLSEDQIQHSYDCPGGPGVWKKCGNSHIKSTYVRFRRMCEKCESMSIQQQHSPVRKIDNHNESDDSEHESFIDSDEEGHWEGGYSMEDVGGRPNWSGIVIRSG